MNKESGFLRGSAPAEEAVKRAEMMTKGLERSIDLADEAGAGFERMDSNLESSTRGKVLSNSVWCNKEISPERKSRVMRQMSICPV